MAIRKIVLSTALIAAFTAPALAQDAEDETAVGGLFDGVAGLTGLTDQQAAGATAGALAALLIAIGASDGNGSDSGVVATTDTN